MIKLVAGLAVGAGIAVGVAAGNAAAGVEVTVGVFVIGLLIIIADALQRLAPLPLDQQYGAINDSDLVDDPDKLYEAEKGL